MIKQLIAVLAAAMLWLPPAASQTLVQKGEGHEWKIDAHLPDPASSVPWLKLWNGKKLLKGDYPIAPGIVELPKGLSMADRKPMKVERRRPNMRRVREAVKIGQEESRGLISDASVALSGFLARTHENATYGGVDVPGNV